MEKMFMKRGRVLVEQVLKDGTIIEEYELDLKNNKNKGVLWNCLLNILWM